MKVFKVRIDLIIRLHESGKIVTAGIVHSSFNSPKFGSGYASDEYTAIRNALRSWKGATWKILSGEYEGKEGTVIDVKVKSVETKES